MATSYQAPVEVNQTDETIPPTIRARSVHTLPTTLASIQTSKANHPSSLVTSITRTSKASRITKLEQIYNVKKRRKLLSSIKFVCIIILINMLFLAILIHSSMNIIDTTDDDVSLGQVIKLFGSGFGSPHSMFWNNITGYLYYMDPNIRRAYRWKPAYGKYKYDYTHINYRYGLIIHQLFWDDFFGELFGYTRLPFKFMLPWKNSDIEFIGGFGPDIANFKWDTYWRRNYTYAWWTKIDRIFTIDQEITVGKASPLGSVFLVCKDEILRTHSLAVVGRYYKRPEIIPQPYPNGFSPKLVHVSGMTWSVDFKKIYMIDTVSWAIISWRYTIETSDETESLNDPELFMSFTDKPYDVIIDGENYLWVTLMGLNQVVRVSTAPEDANMRIKEVYKTPGEVTYGLVIGGDNLDTLIISTGHKVPDGLTVVENVKTTKRGNFYSLNKSVKSGPIYHIDKNYVLKSWWPFHR